MKVTINDLKKENLLIRSIGPARERTVFDILVKSFVKEYDDKVELVINFVNKKTGKKFVLEELNVEETITLTKDQLEDWVIVQ